MENVRLSEDGKSISLLCDLSDMNLSDGDEKQASVGLVENAIYTGSFKHPQGSFSITDKTLSEFVTNFESNTLSITPAINYNHNMHDKAAGWVKRMFKSESDQNLDDSSKNGKKASLNMEIEWTPAARDAIRNKEYKYFSIEFATEWTNSETQAKHTNVVTGGALTNKPFLKGTGVNLEDQENKESKPMTKSEIITQLRDDYDLDVKSLQETVVKLKDSDTKVKSLSEENKSLKEAIELSEKKALESVVEKLLDDCVREGKVVKAQREVYKGHFLSLGQEKAIEAAKAMPVIVKMDSKGSSENESQESDEKMSYEQKIDKSAKKLLSDKKASSYEDAYQLATAE